MNGTPRRLWLLIGFLAAGPARAAGPNPGFNFGFKEDTSAVIWRGTATLGININSGNSNAISFAGSGTIMRNDGSNKVQVDVVGAYARSTSLVGNDANMDGILQRAEITQVTQTTVNNWNLKARYDRFIKLTNSFYLTGFVGADPIAGKQLLGGGQAGFARQVYANDQHQLVAELGYDFTYEQYDQPKMAPGTMAEISSLAIHSARVFVGYKLKLSDEILMASSAEVLSNVNTLLTPTGNAAPFEDTRVIWKASLDARVYKNISARFAFTAKFDNVPAPRQAFNLPLEDGLTVSANKLDTITEVQVIVNFL